MKNDVRNSIKLFLKVSDGEIFYEIAPYLTNNPRRPVPVLFIIQRSVELDRDEEWRVDTTTATKSNRSPSYVV